MTQADLMWLRRQALGLLLVAIALLLVFENTRLDVRLSQYFFDAAAGNFPLQHHWLFERVLHHGFKSAAYVVGLAGIFFCLYAIHRGVPWLSRPQAMLAAIGTVSIPLATTALKSMTNRHCPWDVIDFGGYAPYVSLFATTPGEIARGLCFPAGHASAGFVWVVWYLALRSTRPAWAKWALWAGLLGGMVAGVDRLLQGAHFLSHVLWSGWFAWALSLLLCWLLKVPQGRQLA